MALTGRIYTLYGRSVSGGVPPNGALFWTPTTGIGLTLFSLSSGVRPVLRRLPSNPYSRVRFWVSGGRLLVPLGT